MRFRFPRSGMAGLLFLAACGSEPSGPTPITPEPPKPAPPLKNLVLTAAEGSLSRIGDTIRVAATIDGVPVTALSFEATEESRWLSDVGVASHGGAERLVATGAGTVTYRVSAQGANPATYKLRVAPSMPTVLAMTTSNPRVGPDDTITLRGYLLGLKPEQVAIDGRLARVLAQDSASIRLAVAGEEQGRCALPVRAQIAVRDADVRTGLNVLRRRAGEVALGIGEAKLLSDAELACLRTVPGQQYYAAFMDPRRIEMSRQVQDPYSNMGQFSASVRDLHAPTTAASPTGARVLRVNPVKNLLRGTTTHAPMRSMMASSEPHAITQRNTKWKAGDTFTYQPLTMSWGTSVTVQVIKVYGDYLVLAAPLDQVGLWTGTQLAQFDAAAAFMIAEGIPFFERTIEPGRPTAGSSGQAMLVAKMTAPGANVSSGLASAWTEYGYGDRMEAEGWIRILGHELAHTWHFHRRSREAARTGYGGYAQWNVEGLAEFMQTELLRRFSDKPFLDNVKPDFRAGRGHFWMNSMHGNGAFFTGGYQPVASFLRDQVQRLVTDRRMSIDDAFRTVGQGAAAGWYGCASSTADFDCRAEGLAEAMTRVHGSSWSAPEVLLRWLLSQAADDVTPAPAFQNGTWQGVGTVTPYTFPALGTIKAGDGTTVNANVNEGAVAHFVLEDGGFGGAYQLSSSAPGTQWMLLRTR